MTDRPWLRAIPREDMEAFPGGYDTIDRPIEVGRRSALVIVDMTYDMVDSAYPGGWGPTGWPAVRATRSLLDRAREAGVPVYFTKGYADPGTTPIRGQRGRWKPSQTSDPRAELPPGDRIVKELQPRPDEIVIFKQGKPSGFFGTTLAADLIYDGVDTVVLTGMATSGCLRATALDAFQFNFHVVIVDEACADRSQISHSVTLFDLHMKYADVIGCEQAIALLTARMDGGSPTGGGAPDRRVLSDAVSPAES
jgi:nicotinamidase-related amidase